MRPGPQCSGPSYHLGLAWQGSLGSEKGIVLFSGSKESVPKERDPQNEVSSVKRNLPGRKEGQSCADVQKDIVL